MNEDIKELLVGLVTQASKKSTRNLQAQIGPSEIGGCRRATWNKLNNVEITNMGTSVFAGFMGTAIHTAIEKVFSNHDPYGTEYLLEQTVTDGTLVGHTDLYLPAQKAVVDWKTTTKKSLGYFPSKQQRWQVQLYGYLLTCMGKEVETVSLVAIPRDGNEHDIVVHTEPYDRAMADEALWWLSDVQSMVDAPAPERDVTFCKRYCVYYDANGDGCKGLTRAPKGATLPLIEDTEVANAAKQITEIAAAIKKLEEQQDALKQLLEGYTGQTADGIKVTWSEVAGRSSVDADEVEKLLGFVPMKQGQPSTRLVVKAS